MPACFNRLLPSAGAGTLAIEALPPCRQADTQDKVRPRETLAASHR